MSTAPTLHDRIESAIARKPFAKAADEVLAEIATTHILVPRPDAMPESFPDVAGMSLWELAQAIAINSDLAMHCYEQREENDDRDEHYRKAGIYFQRRGDCIAEIRDREQRGVLVDRSDLDLVFDWIETVCGYWVHMEEEGAAYQRMRQVAGKADTSEVPDGQ